MTARRALTALLVATIAAYAFLQRAAVLGPLGELWRAGGGG